MKVKCFSSILILICQLTFGQDDIKSALRVGLGFQNNFFSEIGYRYKIKPELKPGCAFAYMPNAAYTMIEWTAKSNNFDAVYGVKIGYEQMLSWLLSYGIEAKYQTNFEQKDFVITPKLGFFATQKFSLFYGYNISTNGNPFANVGKHQFSLIFNLNKDTFGKKNLNNL